MHFRTLRSSVPKKPQPIQSEPPPQDKDIASKVRDAEVANILQKLKDGKTLNAREARLVGDFSEGKKKQRQADTIAQAASILGRSQAQIKFARKSGAPGFVHGRVNLDEVEAWLKAEDARAKEKGEGGVYEKDYAARRIKAQAEKLEMEVAAKRDLLIEKTMVRETWSEMIAAFFEIVERAVDRVTYAAIVKEAKITLKKMAK